MTKLFIHQPRGRPAAGPSPYGARSSGWEVGSRPHWSKDLESGSILPVRSKKQAQ